MLGLAHAQASTSADYCAWYDSTNAKNYPRGNNNNLKDVDDSDLGLKGSPTKIAKASDKVPKGAGEKVNLDPTESVNYLMEKFKEKHII